MRSLDLFSCVGCHARGFERAGFETVALCEINPWRRARLKEQWPDTPIYDDVRQPIAIKADIIVGGPPCQRTSVAAAVHGYRTGDSLWPSMLARGLDAGAEWFVVEQPPGNAAWEAAVSGDLSGAGYHVARLEFGACDVGAPYPRRRVYLVACTSLPRLEVAWAAVPSQIAAVKRAADARAAWCPDQLAALPVVARDAGEMDRGERSRERREWIEALGDSNPPEMAEVIGRALIEAER
jgi:DNA (cytosine-5)-methyltransferase 1